MRVDKISVLVGSIHVLIASVIQFYARPYQLSLSHYTDPVFIFIFVLILFTSGYLSHYLYKEKDYLSPLVLLLLWILIGCFIFVTNISSYPIDQFRGLGGNSEFARTFWILRYISEVTPIPAPAPAPDYYISSLWLIHVQIFSLVIEKLARIIKNRIGGKTD